MMSQLMNKDNTWHSFTLSTAILCGQVDMEMGVRFGVRLGKGKKHEKEKKAGVHVRSVSTCS